MFAFQDTRAAVEVAFTDRHGGVSAGAYASLNLARSGGDRPAATEENLRRVTAAFTHGASGSAGTAPGSAGPVPPRLVGMRQVHGADVHVVDEDVPPDAAGRPAVVADALATRAAGVVLMVRVADCVPVLLADPDRSVVGAAHAGRTGMVAGVVSRTVARMRELGAERITAWVGPHVCGACYEVPEQLRDEVSRAVPEAHAETSWGTPALDIGNGVRAQLAAEKVEVVDVSRCTIEDEDLFSYRRQGQASGRLAGLVWVRP